MSPTLMALIRSVVLWVGGYLVTKGFLTPEQFNSNAEGLIGGAMTLSALAWSAYHVYQQRRANAVSATMGTPTVVSGFTLPTVANAKPSPTSGADMTAVRKPV